MLVCDNLEINLLGDKPIDQNTILNSSQYAFREKLEQAAPWH